MARAARTIRRWYLDHRHLSDDRFLQQAYLSVLGRPVDNPARAHFGARLAQGLARRDVLALLEESDEARSARDSRRLPSLRRRRPLRFRRAMSTDGVAIPVYRATSEAHFRWIERQILANGYYERPGEWSLGDDDDKAAMAAFAASFEPMSVVELGCSTGAVLGHLLRRGIDVQGVDISELARSAAAPEVRDRIVLGDMETVDLGRTFDLALALDVLEHVRPARLGGVLATLRRHLRDDGLLVANVPAYGDDDRFGCPFPVYVTSWQADAAGSGLFRDLLVDREGYPLHGHLIWATVDWWTCRFRDAGFERDAEREQATQERMAAHFAAHPARRTTFVLRAAG